MRNRGIAQLAYLRRGVVDYPLQLTDYMGEQAPPTVALKRECSIWFERAESLPALFCSTKAPASITLQIHDLAQQWRTGGVMVISGFHSPVEQECLAVLLHGPGAGHRLPGAGPDQDAPETRV